MFCTKRSRGGGHHHTRNVLSRPSPLSWLFLLFPSHGHLLHAAASTGLGAASAVTASAGDARLSQIFFIFFSVRRDATSTKSRRRASPRTRSLRRLLGRGRVRDRLLGGRRLGGLRMCCGDAASESSCTVCQHRLAPPVSPRGAGGAAAAKDGATRRERGARAAVRNGRR